MTPPGRNGRRLIEPATPLPFCFSPGGRGLGDHQTDLSNWHERFVTLRAYDIHRQQAAASV